MSAISNFSRSTGGRSGSGRPHRCSRRRGCARRTALAICCLVWWIAGMMMWDGFSPASWTMYSPMSDSRRADAGGFHGVVQNSISSLTIDLPLTTRAPAWRWAMPSMMALVRRASRPSAPDAVAGQDWPRAVRAGRAVCSRLYWRMASDRLRSGPARPRRKLGGALGHQEVHRAAEALAQVGHSSSCMPAPAGPGPTRRRWAGRRCWGPGLLMPRLPSALMTITTSSLGPWAPKARVCWMSAVLDGPEISSALVGRPAAQFSLTGRRRKWGGWWRRRAARSGWRHQRQAARLVGGRPQDQAAGFGDGPRA